MDKLNIIFGIIGVLGAIFGAYAIWDSHKTRKVNSFIFEVAKMNVDKDVTQNELEELITKRHEMLNAIKIIQEQVPFEAQKAVLFDRYKILEEQMINTYNAYIETRSKLEKLIEINTAIPELILTEIKQEIMPEYVIRQRKNKHLISLTVISFATSIFSALPVIGYYGRFLGLLYIVPLAGLFIVNIPANKQDKKKYIKKLALLSTTILAGIASVICALLYYDALGTRYKDETVYLIILLFSIPMLLALSIYIIIKSYVSKKKKI